MREDDHGARYLSPLVKQDLAKLDTDGDTRRLAVKSLKLFVEQLDASTLPRFISQVAESREPGSTRSYAISLYEEVARVHGKLVVPYIPKVMAAVIRSSASSGSFPQLQFACARVTAALARHCITSVADAEEILAAICAPLVDALSGKLEPVAATAAACLHALAETEHWKHVREETVHEVCYRTAVALSEKATRTAAHMQLIRILASVSPDVVSVHGASLLRAGEEILKVNANSWQLRKAAAQLLQSVLTVLDKETLDTELDSALHALDSCRLDKMPHVRAAVSEALHTAKMLASGTVSSSAWSPRTPVSVFNSPRGVGVSPTSQESRRFSFSPTSTGASESSAHAPSARKRGTRAKRAPLYPARPLQSPRWSPSSSTTTVEECESPSRRLNVNEFNKSGRVYPEEDGAVPAQQIDLEMKEAQVDGTTQPEPTSMAHDISSGEDLRVDAHVEVVLPRLKMSNAGEHACDERITPTLKDSSTTPSDDELDHVDVEVEKREVFTEFLQTPKAASLQHRTNFSFRNGGLELDESVSMDFPKRLVRSLSKLSTPEPSHDVKMLSQPDDLLPADAAADETSSEAGWSVRDNPIASEDSFRGESSDEEFTTTYLYPKPASLTVSPRSRVLSPTPPDDSEQMRRLLSPGPCKSVQSPTCGLSSLLHHDETSAKCSESTCRVSETSIPVSEKDVKENLVETGQSERCSVRMVSQKCWKKLRWYTETALGGSLCLVIALPLAMIAAKALNHGARDCHHLVPT